MASTRSPGNSFSKMRDDAESNISDETVHSKRHITMKDAVNRVRMETSVVNFTKKHVLQPGELASFDLEEQDNLAHKLLDKELARRVTEVFDKPCHSRTFDLWVTIAFCVWTFGWYTQNWIVFLVCFVVGFTPPSLIIVLTANLTLLRLLLKEFTQWYIMGNMLGFSVTLPFISTSHGAVVGMQIVGQMFSAWLYCNIDSVNVTYRFKLVFGTWLIGFWLSFYYFIEIKQAPWFITELKDVDICQEYLVHLILYNTSRVIIVRLTGSAVHCKCGVHQLAQSFLMNSIIFTAQQVWKILRRRRSATIINLVPAIKWKTFHHEDRAKSARDNRDNAVRLTPGSAVVFPLEPTETAAYKVCCIGSMSSPWATAHFRRDCVNNTWLSRSD